MARLEEAPSARAFHRGRRKVEAWGSTLELGDAMGRYAAWPQPTAIIVDGPYGVAGFPGDSPTTAGLAEWYAPHVAEWSKYATPQTTLWFWGTEVGWATVHPVLELHGWRYRVCHVWDKGMAHVAGNVNSKTIRSFPVVTEVCVQYVRDALLPTEACGALEMKAWLRHEWARAGLALYLTNEAAGVKNAATRKWFTQCHLWYYPPPDAMVRLAEYAAAHGKPTSRPYFSLDGTKPLTEAAWGRLRSKWYHEHAVTNVWREPGVRGSERLKNGLKALHACQKPLSLTDRIIRASTDPGDVVWDPFGGLCSGIVASMQSGRTCLSAEVNADYFRAAAERIREAASEVAARVRTT
jgi:hypothetical protein